MKDFDFFISFFRNRIESSSLAIYPFDANIKKKHLIEKRLSYIVITKDKLLFCGYFWELIIKEFSGWLTSADTLKY